MNYNHRLDTYGLGCQHGCRYCYAEGLLDFRGHWSSIKPAVADIKKISVRIKQLPKDVYILRMGGMTDCFQPIELKYRVTYETIKLLNKAGIEYLIITKSPLVASDEYLKILDKDLAHIQMSITSLDDNLCKTYECFAPPPTARVAAVEKLEKLGYDVQVRLSPYIPHFVNKDELNRIRCSKILIEFLRVSGNIKKQFPEFDYSEYTLFENGSLNLPLEKKIEYIKGIDGFEQLSVAALSNRAYVYFRDNVNHNPNDCCNLRNSRAKPAVSNTSSFTDTLKKATGLIK